MIRRQAPVSFRQISLDGYDDSVVAQHIKYLWQSKLVSSVYVTHMQSPCVPEIAATDITPGGRAYLDANEPEPPRNKMGF
jgi:hypothetical protein